MSGPAHVELSVHFYKCLSKGTEYPTNISEPYSVKSAVAEETDETYNGD